MTQLNVQVGSKRLELLHEAIGKATVIAYLINPNEFISDIADMQDAARNLGIKLRILNASTEPEFDAAFANVVPMRAGGLVIGSSSFFVAHQEELAALAVHHAVPAIFENREFAVAGGLMSYGGNVAEGYRMAGVYVGRILERRKGGRTASPGKTKSSECASTSRPRGRSVSIPQTRLSDAPTS